MAVTPSSAICESIYVFIIFSPLTNTFTLERATQEREVKHIANSNSF